jgi:hypothetical protein
MANRSPENRPLQKVNAGKNAEVVGRDKITTTNISVWISFLLTGVLAFGGIAWAINAGWLRGSGNPQLPNANPPTKKDVSP